MRLISIIFPKVWVKDLNPTQVMNHQPVAAFYKAQMGEFVMEAEELVKLHETITKVYVQKNGQALMGCI
ncbi:hypothetical protein VitviT2T_022802 [Vitis vinifera]|uniref:Uncharacterized protein n=2 Tax=Vitis vinifera TaxID=29760 RepID=A0ABY9DDH1_VITVI